MISPHAIASDTFDVESHLLFPLIGSNRVHIHGPGYGVMLRHCILDGGDRTPHQATQWSAIGTRIAVIERGHMIFGLGSGWPVWEAME